MKITQSKINKFYNKILKDDFKKIEPTQEHMISIFPFELTMGYVNSTETGLSGNNINISDYSTFSRIFTGLENTLAKWEDAYEVKKVNDTDLFLTKEYKVGRIIKGISNSLNSSANFELSSISSDFIQENTDETVAVMTYDNWDHEADTIKLFIIPERKFNKWLFVESATKYFTNDGKYSYTMINFRTLNSKIAKSGRAIEEFVQRAAPGEGYAYPVQNEKGEWVVDDIRSRDIPITSMQIEMSGAAAINSIVAYGRPTITETINGVEQTIFNPKIHAPRLLLPFRLETPIPSPLNTRPSAETDYYIGDFTPTLQTQYKSWKEQFTNSYDLTARNQYEGVLTGGTLADLRSSNPIDSKGTHTHTLWDKNFFKNIANKTYDTSADRFTENSITLNGDYTVSEIMSHNHFLFSYITTLPLTIQQNVAWNLASIPLVGGFLSKITGGVDIGWNDKSIRLGMPDVKLIMPASIAEYGAVLKGDGTASTDTWIPLETFTGDRKDEATEFSGINATGTIFKIQFTDRFEKTIDGVKHIFNLNDLMQDMPAVDDDGKPIAKPSGKLIWTADCKTVARNSSGFVIDAINFKALAKMDYRASFYSNDIPTWSGTYQTQAKFTGSIRDWTNTIKMSDWSEDNGKKINYPADIVAPNPPNINYPKVSLPIDLQVQKRPEPPNFAPAYKQYIFDLGVDFKDGNSVNKEFTYPSVEVDLTPFGTISELKNNYDYLAMTIDKRNGETETVNILTANLIDTGDVNLTVRESQRFKMDFLADINIYDPYSQGWIQYGQTKTIENFEMAFNWSEKLELNLNVQGLKLIITPKMVVNSFPTRYVQATPNLIYQSLSETKTIVSNTADFNKFAFDINQIIAKPKNI